MLLCGPAWAACSGASPTWTAANCSATEVNACITASSAGDTINVPAGASCDWTAGIALTGRRLVGAGKSTSGTVVTGGTVTITKHASQLTRLSGFRFTGSGRHVTATGSASDRAYVVDANHFNMVGTGTATGVRPVNGGLFFGNDFVASTPSNADLLNVSGGALEWNAPAGNPTLGDLDTTGETNLYFEDNTFTNILETAPDLDDGTRGVIRFNTYTDSSIVMHSGAPNDSGATEGGHRHVEIYGNLFDRVTNAYAINKWVWLRGGTAVIANNSWDDANSPDGSSYTGKKEIQLSVGCPGSYPTDLQVGQLYLPSENPPSFPVQITNNTQLTGSFNVSIEAAPQGGGCATPASFIQANRDYFQSVASGSFNGTSGSGHGTLANRPATCTAGVYYWATDQGNWNGRAGGTQGRLYKCTATDTWSTWYTPFKYPHPLRVQLGPTAPALN